MAHKMAVAATDRMPGKKYTARSKLAPRGLGLHNAGDGESEQ